jgi:hypothetical protein
MIKKLCIRAISVQSLRFTAARWRDHLELAGQHFGH